MKNIRWGILGTGKIARAFAEDLKYASGAVLQAVGSRTTDQADSFGDLFDIPNRHGSYEDLAADPEVDVVYIATPHTLHAVNSLLCLRSNKAVLCEKPFAINEREAGEVFKEARARNLFIMEAMWSRYFPLYADIWKLINDNVIGDVQFIRAEFGFFSDYDPEARLFNPELGGGALLDIGIYPIDVTQFLMRRPPVSILADAVTDSTGIDLQSSYILRYDNGVMAALSSSLRTDLPNEAIISGTRGSIRVHAPFWHPDTATVQTKGTQTITSPFQGYGYHFEADEVMRCLREGKLESPAMPASETLSRLHIMDAIRGSLGICYPSERSS